MATTKEQAEAYDYEARRQATTLVTGRDEARTDPRRRINRVTAAGVLVGVLVMAGFGIAGFLGAGRGPALPESGAVLVAGSGDRYVVVDGRLHPALNLASALLVGGGSVAQVRPVALDALPRGLPVGIPEAPDALPAPERLSIAPWTVCAVPSGAATLPPEVTVRVAAPEPAAGAVDAGQAVLATSPDGTRWMVNQGRRYRLADAAAQRVGLQRATPLALPAEILDLLPEGPPIAAPGIAGPGAPVAGVPRAWVAADVVRVQAGGAARESLAVLPDGVVPVSELTAALLVSGDRTRSRPTRDGRHGTSIPHPVPRHRGLARRRPAARRPSATSRCACRRPPAPRRGTRRGRSGSACPAWCSGPASRPCTPGRATRRASSTRSWCPVVPARWSGRPPRPAATVR